MTATSRLFLVAALLAMGPPARAADAPKVAPSGPFTALVRTPSGGLAAQSYMDISGLAVIEGDIVIGTHEDVQKETLSNLREVAHGLDDDALKAVEPGALARLRTDLDTASPPAAPGGGHVARPFSLSVVNRLWPNKTVPFVIDASIPAAQRGTVLQAAHLWNALYLVKFREVTADQAASDALRVVAIDGSGVCLTDQPGHNRTNTTHLSSDCTLYQIVHEFGHVLGLRHEQSRTDRDGFIAIDESKILDRYKPNFDTQPGSFDATRYDPCSIMHYGNVVPGQWTTTQQDETWFTLTALGRSTFAACARALPQRPECQTVGQRCAISPTDRKGIANLYH